MKAKQLATMSLALLMAVGLMTTGWAGSPESANIFKNPGSKQTAEDFKPAPAKMQTNFGTLEFEGGAFPNKASVQKIYDELDLQRATQAYMDFFPALSLYAIVKSQVRDFGFKSSSDISAGRSMRSYIGSSFLSQYEDKIRLYLAQFLLSLNRAG